MEVNLKKAAKDYMKKPDSIIRNVVMEDFIAGAKWRDSLPNEDEKGFINKMNSMCQESLDPETFEKWEEVKKWLLLTRKKLK